MRAWVLLLSISALGACTSRLPLRVPANVDPDCTSLLRSMLGNNPRSAPVGIAYVHEYQVATNEAPMLVKLIVPFMPVGRAAHIEDLGQRAVGVDWPRRFIISDGHTQSPFILVDLSPGGSLDQQLDLFIANMRDRGIDLADANDVVEDLSKNGRGFFRSATNQLQGLKHSSFTTSRNELGRSAKAIWNDLSPRQPSAFVHATDESRDLAPFEMYLAKPACTMCIHNAMLTSFILQKLGVPHRMRPGFAATNGPSTQNTGHTLIELADGRYLDPTWNFVEKLKAHPDLPDWLESPHWWWTPNAHFPFVVLD